MHLKTASAFLLIAFVSTTALSQKKVVTAAQANGTYRSGENEIRILAFGKNKLRIQMDLLWRYRNPEPGANIGEAHGEATIEDEVATFRPEGTEDCTITIKFLPRNKIKVTEDHMLNCGFGFNVSSQGIYRKVRGGQPKFDSDK